MTLQLVGWWRLPPKEKFRQLKYTHIGQERKKGIACDNHLTYEQLIKTLEYFDCKCPFCSDLVCDGRYVFGYLDHLVAISRGGKFEFGNIVVSCVLCNMAKRDVDLDEWLQLKCTPAQATRIRRFKSGL